MDDELEHSPWSWLDDFTQHFSWFHPSARASLFLNNYFLLGVTIVKYVSSNLSIIIHYYLCELLVSNVWQIAAQMNLYSGGKPKLKTM